MFITLSVIEGIYNKRKYMGTERKSGKYEGFSKNFEEEYGEWIRQERKKD